MKKIDVHLLVKDEIELIEGYLEQFENWESLGRIVAVDTGSTDGTFELLQDIPQVQVSSHPLNMDFSTARNFGLAWCLNKWVLQLDADERLSEGLLEWITAFVASEDALTVEMVAIHRENLVEGHDIGPNTHEAHIRLFRAHRRFQGRIHESLRRGVLERVIEAPSVLPILHHKTSARQERQNALYQLWKEQPRC